MRLYLFLVCSCATLVLKGQQLLPLQYDTTFYSQEFIVNGIADYSSTSIENDLSQKFIFGGTITEEIKDRSFERHHGINRFGFDVSSEIEYRNMQVNLFKKSNWGFILKGGYYNYLSGIYSKDLFGLAFYGNEKYLGENINFSGSRLSAMAFQKVGFGLVNKKTKSTISFNLYSISDYAQGVTKEGQLFQSESGDSISLTLDGSFEYASSQNFLKGYGFGIDLDYKIPFVLQQDKVSYIQFLVKNIGIAHINSSVTRYSADTTIYYDGLTFDQLIGENSILNDSYSLYNSLGIDSSEITKVRFLPGFIQVGKIVDEHSQGKIQSFFGFRMYPSVTYVPLVYVGLHLRTTNWLDIGANVSYGGYTNLRFGFYTQVKLKNLAIGISSEDVFGLVSKSGLGESITCRLRYKI